jgi:hypothetical protein
LICGAFELPDQTAAVSPATVAPALERHVQQVDSGAPLEHLHGQVVLAAVAAGGVRERRVRLLRVIDELREGAHRQRRVDGQHELVGRHRHHRREIAQRVDRHLVEVRIDGDLAVGEQAERVAIGLRARDELVGNVAVGTRLVLHHHRMADVLRQLVRDHARRDVRRAARRDRNDDGDRPGARKLGESRRADGEKNEEQKTHLHVGPECFGRRDWTRTNDPHHVKVVL